ncbi:oxalurate catabolism protein HpxZ [Catenulispora yoronensis]|uniref:Oxalurate catabolism protein HpxZ n=1 Tax=Catenulispora yoronensis TaxID=450799 RepID=A0ABN2TJ43_9ACTN
MPELPVDDPAALAEVLESFARYEKALTTNDIAVLDELFHDSPNTVRLGAGEELFGYPAIAEFRRARPASGLARDEVRSQVTVYGDAFAVTSLVFTREGTVGFGRQTQSWVRFADGWRIVAAHVSQRG